MGQRAVPNFQFLSNALEQLGPWKGKSVKVDIDWYRKKMSRRIEEVDFDKAKDDVQRFLRPVDVKTLELWNKKVFLDCLKRVGT